ncbi:hypothetical protein SESBI_01432 [Sesbania bispinosa]|nr:hypothetical protein SESBI_01432 [Sesbania bispinosa]
MGFRSEEEATKTRRTRQSFRWPRLNDGGRTYMVEGDEEDDANREAFPVTEAERR